MRDKKLDNIKCLGILLIVLGHMLEVVDCGKIGSYIYMTIYSFHVPLFIFVMGYFSKSKRWEWLRILILYLAFQTMYLLAFNLKHLIIGEFFMFDYVTPYWLLWFLLLMLYYKLITPILLKLTINKRIVVLIASIIISLFSSCLPFLNYKFSLMRAVTFLPYFIFGTIWKEAKLNIRGKYIWLVFVVVCSIYVSIQHIIDVNVMYGVSGSPLQRTIVYLIATIWIIFLMSWMPNRELSKTISKVGQNTLSIFLLHGLIIKVVSSFWQPQYGFINVIICIASAIVLCIMFGQEKLTKVLSLKFK